MTDEEFQAQELKGHALAAIAPATVAGLLLPATCGPQQVCARLTASGGDDGERGGGHRAQAGDADHKRGSRFDRETSMSEGCRRQRGSAMPRRLDLLRLNQGTDSHVQTANEGRSATLTLSACREDDLVRQVGLRREVEGCQVEHDRIPAAESGEQGDDGLRQNELD